MAEIFQRIIRHKGREYRIEVDFDDAAITQDSAPFEIRAAFRDLGQKDWNEISLTIDLRYAEGVLVVRQGEREIGRIPLDLALAPAEEPTGTDIDIDADSALIEDALGAKAVEELIHLIPSDPIFGCIVKSAVSTAVGQIIRCWRQVGKAENFKDKAYRVGACLRDYGARMALTFMWRAGRCAATLGMG